MLILFISLISLQSAARADETGFQLWLSGFYARAQQQGFDPNFLNTKLSNVSYIDRAITLDQKQPENKITFAQYRKNVVTADRIKKGRAFMAEHRALLQATSKAYGVPPQYIVALWGIETNFGTITGNFDILSVLATLAYEGRRSAFFEGELMAALKILEEGHIGVDGLKGSWAGAMGQCQFMPSSFLKYAQDGDGDGNMNIWTSLPDVFASMANYLKTEGWNRDLRWGRAVSVPARLPETVYGRDKMRPLSDWIKLGVRLPNGKPLHRPADGSNPMAGLVAPDGVGTPTYLVYENYNVIMHWNRSTYFATSVGLLADAIAN